MRGRVVILEQMALAHVQTEALEVALSSSIPDVAADAEGLGCRVSGLGRPSSYSFS